MDVENRDSDTFPKLLLHHSKQRGERPAIREKNRGIWRITTWRMLAEEVASLAAALSARGVQRGGHVVLLGENRPHLYAAMCAAQWLGAIAVPLYQDAAADELVDPIQKSDATHVFAENQEQVDKLLKILPRCPSIRCIVYDKDRGMRHYKQPQLVSYAAFLQQGRELAAAKRDFLQSELARGAGQDAAFLFFTSGTTGPAKGVVLTHASLIDRARVAAKTEGLSDSDVAMAYLPPGWIGQNFFGYAQPLVVGYCACCPESPETMLADMREIGPTCFLATPRVLEALLTQILMRVEDSGRFNQAVYRRCMAVAQRAGARILAGEAVPIGDRIAFQLSNILVYGPLRDVLGMSKLRVAYSAGDAIAPDLLMYFRSLGINLKQLYGSTETGFFVAMQRDGKVHPDTVGAATDGVELKFTPQSEILVRSPGLLKEYHRAPDITRQTRNAEGWFHTGDAGFLGNDGQIRVIDRITNIGALTDGTPYAPRLLENRLKIFPYIKEAVVFGNGRDRVCALVDIDIAAVGRWADKKSISYTGHADLASRDEVYELIAECIRKVNATLALDPRLSKSQIHRFSILHKELTASDGFLTHTGMLRRSAIADLYHPLVDAMYQGRAEMRIGNAHGDGQAGTAEADIKIRDAIVISPVKARRVV